MPMCENGDLLIEEMSALSVFVPLRNIMSPIRDLAEMSESSDMALGVSVGGASFVGTKDRYNHHIRIPTQKPTLAIAIDFAKSVVFV